MSAGQALAASGSSYFPHVTLGEFGAQSPAGKIIAVGRGPGAARCGRPRVRMLLPRGSRAEVSAHAPRNGSSHRCGARRRVRVSPGCHSVAGATKARRTTASPAGRARERACRPQTHFDAAPAGSLGELAQPDQRAILDSPPEPTGEVCRASSPASSSAGRSGALEARKRRKRHRAHWRQSRRCRPHLGPNGHPRCKRKCRHHAIYDVAEGHEAGQKRGSCSAQAEQPTPVALCRAVVPEVQAAVEELEVSGLLGRVQVHKELFARLPSLRSRCLRDPLAASHRGRCRFQ